MTLKKRIPRPKWLKVRLPGRGDYIRLKAVVRAHRLNTVCESARCPNIAECWGAGTATFMILGAICTRACRFCAVNTGVPIEYDADEPRRIAAAVRELGLKYAVLTSVNRDDLEDGGATLFAESIRSIKETSHGIGIEVLIPDFQGNIDALQTVLGAQPDVLAHNVETVPRLYPTVRPGSAYLRSLEMLLSAKGSDVAVMTKSGLMLGLGERADEVRAVLSDLRQAQVDIVTIGQYLQPTGESLQVVKFYTPDEFSEYRDYAYSLGFRYVAAGPLVRSSYHAERQMQID